jgi:hypothetical protein
MCIIKDICMKNLPLILTLAMALLVSAPAFTQDKQHNMDELNASIPILSDFHEIIYPLWHQAWPNKDIALVKELLPKVESYTVDIEKVPLPGILRDKESKWKAGVEALRKSTNTLKEAVNAGTEKPIMDAVETLHTNYEKLVRLIRPLTKEIDAFHQVLYMVYHYYMPEKNIEKLREAAKEMVAKSEAIAAAATPRKAQSKEAEYKAAVQKLLASCLVLVGTAKGDDINAIDKAVETVHTDYQSIEKMFE